MTAKGIEGTMSRSDTIYYGIEVKDAQDRMHTPDFVAASETPCRSTVQHTGDIGHVVFVICTCSRESEALKSRLMT